MRLSDNKRYSELEQGCPSMSSEKGYTSVHDLLDTQDHYRSRRHRSAASLARPTVLALCSALACYLLWSRGSVSISSGSPQIEIEPSWSKAPRGKFLHLTDIHPDQFYLEGAAISTSCHTILPDEDEPESKIGGPISNRGQRQSTDSSVYSKNSGTRNPRSQGVTSKFSSRTASTIEDTVGGRFGAPNSICDSPFSLVDAVFGWIDKNLLDSIDFVVWTGDNARHDSDNTHPRTQEQINQLNQAIAERFLRISPPGPLPDNRLLPVVPSIGNNDVYPHNILAPGPNPIFQFFATLWSEFIPESQLNTFRRGGYYSSDVVPGKIRVFALNTLYFYAPNVLADGCTKEGEPGTEEMDWLETKLESVRQKKMVAYLTGHVPPDKFSYSPTCYNRYTKIALAFQDVIVGHLFGHANIDHFFLLSRKSRKHKRPQAGDDGPDEDDNDGDSEDDNNNTRALEDPIQAFGLSAYVEDLMLQYEAVLKPLKNRDYAVALVSPAVVPTYQPTLRVFGYQLGNETSEEPSNPGEDEIDETCMEHLQQDAQLLDEHDGEEAEMIRRRMKSQKKHGRKRHHRKRPKIPNPAPVSTFGYPLEFTQYITNLTLANENQTPPEFVAEYNTRVDYGLQDLSAFEWLALARRIATDEDLRTTYLTRLVVQSKVEGVNTAIARTNLV